MRYVTIPFRSQFREAMLSGQKNATSWPRRYGDIGDCFEAFGAKFEIINVGPVSLGIVAEVLWKEEGFANPQEFWELWRTLHPRKKWGPDDTVYVHRFKKVQP